MEDPNQFFCNFFMTTNVIYYSFKIFARFWLAKSTHIIWRNFALNELMASKVQCSCRLRHRYRENLGMRLSCFNCENNNGETFCVTFYSFHDDLLSKNIARRQLDGQNLLFGAIWSIFWRPEQPFRFIEEGKHVLACF